jgi:hypothetical protein
MGPGFMTVLTGLMGFLSESGSLLDSFGWAYDFPVRIIDAFGQLWLDSGFFCQNLSCFWTVLAGLMSFLSESELLLDSFGWADEFFVRIIDAFGQLFVGCCSFWQNHRRFWTALAG